MKNLPVLNIKKFSTNADSFYVDYLSNHLKKHHFIHHPHKHDFFLCVVFIKGQGQHEIDFKTYNVKQGSVFFLSPGQMHNWKLSSDTEGYILFHTKEFYELHYRNCKVQDYLFYASLYNTPCLTVPLKKLKEVNDFFELMISEFKEILPYKTSKLASLLDLIYINLSRLYFPGEPFNNTSTGYLVKIRKLESLIDIHFKEKKSPAIYAELLNITGKHLNRMVKDTLNKTVSEMIADRIILEAKRLIAQHKYSISQVADELGYYDRSYFNRFFKKHAKLTPHEFAKNILKK
ncbi:MAG: transcriptional regulator [Bacteroidetes bacterium]|nr:transcriptional regulator [Bacteroidota bacterium]